MPIDEALIRSLPIFAGAGEAAIRVLSAGGIRRAFAPGTVLWLEGSAPLGLYVVQSGEVRVVRGRAGRLRVVHIEGAGGTLGEIPLFEGRTYPATAIASRRTECIAFSRDVVLDAIRADPDFALALLGRLAGRVRQLIERIERVSTLSVPARLAAFLLERHAQAEAATITLGRPQTDVAEELGTVREVIVRGLRALREAGLIESAGRGRLRITDEAGLRRLANAPD